MFADAGPHTEVHNSPKSQNFTDVCKGGEANFFLPLGVLKSILFIFDVVFIFCCACFIYFLLVIIVIVFACCYALSIIYFTGPIANRYYSYALDSEMVRTNQIKSAPTMRYGRTTVFFPKQVIMNVGIITMVSSIFYLYLLLLKRYQVIALEQNSLYGMARSCTPGKVNYFDSELVITTF